MLKKGLFISSAMSLVVMVFIAFRNIHLYYKHHIAEYEKASLYLTSDVCTKLSSKLSDFSKCEDSKRIVNMSPAIAAWYDFLEDMFVCGHGRCHQLWEDIMAKLPYISLILGVVFCWTGYQGIQVQRAHNAAMFYQLPLRLPHPHVD